MRTGLETPFVRATSRHRWSVSVRNVAFALFVALVAFRLLIDVIELYRTTSFSSPIHQHIVNLVGGGSRTLSSQPLTPEELRQAADQLNPIRSIKSNVSWTEPGFCMDLNTVPIDELRSSFPIKVMEVRVFVLFVCLLLLYRYSHLSHCFKNYNFYLKFKMIFLKKQFQFAYCFLRCFDKTFPCVVKNFRSLRLHCRALNMIVSRNLQQQLLIY
jgi:hypothetical protein